MEHLNELKVLMQSVVKDMYHAEKYCKSYMTKAQKIGLQGEKRRFRYESTKYHNIINYFECDFYDLYGVDIVMQHEEPVIPTVTGVSDFCKKVLQYFEMQFSKYHSSANALVLKNAKHYAGLLYDKCDCIAEYIKEYRRIIMEGDAVGWSDAYIQRLMLHETTWCNTHDAFEDKEKSVGYDF